MSSEIASMVNELQALTTEIKNRTKELFKLRARKDDLDQKILEFLDEKNLPGAKYKNIAVVSSDKSSRIRKKKTEKMEEAVSILRHHGISNGEKIFHEIQEALKGDQTSKKVLKISDVNKN
jgi:3-mercaptopyruvate sulfurtransferase SseA